MIKRSDKRGEEDNPLKIIVWFAGIFVVIILLSMLYQSGVFNFMTKNIQFDTKQTDSFETIYGSGFKVLDYILGQIPHSLVEFTGKNSAAIIVICIWFLIFFTFGDIISAFSTFSQPISWIIGFLVSVIAANLKAVVWIGVISVGIFAGLGTIAVFAGLFAAFVAFFAVNWGIGRFGPWVMRRRVMMEAGKKGALAEAGAAEIGGTLRGLKQLGKDLRKK